MKFHEIMEALNPLIKIFIRVEQSIVARIKSSISSARRNQQASVFRKKICKAMISCWIHSRCYGILLNEARIHNLHTETVNIFLDFELFSTALATLSYFSYHVSFPPLNCVEKAEQNDLLVLFPKL